MTKLSTIHRTAHGSAGRVNHPVPNEAFLKLSALLEDYDWFRMQAHQMLLDYADRLKDLSTPLVEESLAVQGWHPECGIPIEQLGGYCSAQRDAVDLAAAGLNGLDSAMRQVRTLALLLSKHEGE